MNTHKTDTTGCHCALVYLVLCGLTLLTAALGIAGVSGHWVAPLVLGLALLKGQMIGDWFMELRGVRGIWRWAVTAWLTLVGIAIASAFLITA